MRREVGKGTEGKKVQRGRLKKKRERLKNTLKMEKRKEKK